MRLTRLTAVAFAVVSLGLACPDGHAASEDDLKGSWRVMVTPTATDLCGPATPIPPAFLELASYSAGGVFRETNTQLNFISAGVSPAFPLSGGDGLGAWKAVDSGFSVNFVKLLYDGVGNYIGEADFLEHVEVSGNSLSGAFTIQFKFLAGGPAICGAGTITGRRIVAP